MYQFLYLRMQQAIARGAIRDTFAVLFRDALRTVARGVVLMGCTYMLGANLCAAADLGYAGRLTDGADAPLEGPVDINVRFFSASTGGEQLGTTLTFTSVALQEGTFHLTMSLTPAQVQQIFGNGLRAVFIEIEAARKIYPRQQYLFVPYALRVPIDQSILHYDTEGALTVERLPMSRVMDLNVALAGKANKDAGLDGDVSGTLGSTTVEKIRGVLVASPDKNADKGKFLKYDGTNFVLAEVASSGSGSLNLDGITDVALARTSLGLGSLATANIVTSSDISDGSVTDGDISDTAAIADGKLATITSVGKVSGNAITSGTIGGSASIATSGQIASTGNIRVAGTGITPTELRFGDRDDSHFVGFKSADNLSANIVWTLPVADGPAGSFLATNGSGNLSWTAPSINLASASQVQGVLGLDYGGTGSTTADGARASLRAAESGANKDITSLLGLTTALSVAQGGTGASLSSTGGTGQYLKQTTVGGAVTVGGIPASDITTALGFEPLSKSYADSKIGGFDFDQKARNQDYVIKWDTNQGKYVLAADQTGSPGGGLTQFNGLNSSSQTLAIGQSGETPAFVSSGSTHTLQLPMASGAGVSAGLISHAEYNIFNSKQSLITPASTVNAGSFTTKKQMGLKLNPYGDEVGNTGEVQFNELADNGTNYVGFKSADSLSVNTIWTLPRRDGEEGQLLRTNGSGVLSWVSGAAPTGDAGGDLGGKYPSPTVERVRGMPADVIVSLLTKVSTATPTKDGMRLVERDEQGDFSARYITATLLGKAENVTGIVAAANGGTGTSTAEPSSFFAGPVQGPLLDTPKFRKILPNDLPDLDAAKITTGTLAVAQGGTGASSSTANYVFAAPNGTSGAPSFRALVASDIPSLEFTKMIGTLGVAQGGTGASSSTANYVFAAPNGTSGAPSFRALVAADIPSLEFTKMTGTLGVAQGGTGASSATANAVFAAPNGSSGAPTFRTLVAADIPSLDTSKITTGRLAVAQGGTGTSSSIANTVFAAPNGTSGAPSFRALVAADIPNLEITKITGTLGVTQGGTGVSSSTANYVFAAPSGTGGAPSFRALVVEDIPSLDASKITTGQLAVAQGGTGTSSSTANTVFAAPSTGTGAPSFRSLVAADIPPLAADKITSGILSSSLINWASPGAIGSSSANSAQFTSLTAVNSANFATTSGNVGIGTVTPGSLLGVGNASQFRVSSTGSMTTSGDASISGRVILPTSSLALVNGANNDIAIGNASTFRVTGPTAAFSVTGMQGGVDGRIVNLINTTTFPMTILNDSASSLAVNNRIFTAGRPNLVIGGGGSMMFVYDGNASRWRAVQTPYEEGSFTPSYTGASTSGTCSQTLQTGRYTRIGRQVSISIALTWSCTTAPTGTPLITGLPYPAANISSFTQNVSFSSSGTYTFSTSASGQLIATIAPNTSRVQLQIMSFSSGSVTNALIDSSATIFVTGSYFTD